MVNICWCLLVIVLLYKDRVFWLVIMVIFGWCCKIVVGYFLLYLFCNNFLIVFVFLEFIVISRICFVFIMFLIFIVIVWVGIFFFFLKNWRFVWCVDFVNLIMFVGELNGVFGLLNLMWLFLLILRICRLIGLVVRMFL